MINFILGVSITFNIISILIFIMIYKIGFRELKKKIGNIILDSNKIDTDFLDDIKVGDLKYDN